MAGVSVQVSVEGLDLGLSVLEKLADAPKHELLDGLGRLVQEQTRRRISSEKTSPGGAAWPANRQGTSILVQSGALMNSIDYSVGGDTAQIGTGLIYAGIHQHGGVITPKSAKALVFTAGNALVFAQSVTIPQRQFLGISADNEQELKEATEEWVEGLLQ